MKRSADAAHLEWLEPESDEGNVEYKLRLKDPSTMRFQQLVTQMKFRLSEGNGECFYYLGEPTYDPLLAKFSSCLVRRTRPPALQGRPVCWSYHADIELSPAGRLRAHSAVIYTCMCGCQRLPDIFVVIGLCMILEGPTGANLERHCDHPERPGS